MPTFSRKQHTQIVLGVVLGVVLVWLLFRKTDWRAVLSAIGGVDWRWLVACQILAFAGHFARAQRWSYVVRAARPASYRHLFSATQIGFLVNFTAPARLGEVVRAYVLGRLVKAPFAQCLSMVALDRVGDVLGLLALMLVALISFPAGVDARFPAGAFGNAEPFVVSGALLGPAAAATTGLLCALLAVLVFLYARQAWVLRALDAVGGRLPRNVAGRLRGAFLHFAEGMHVLRSAGGLAKASFLSLATWGAGVLSVAAILKAFGVDFPWHAPFLILALIAVFISFPVTPAVVGQYHLPVVAGLLLTVPGTAPDEAKAVALVAHLMNLLPIAALGLFCLWRERLGFVQVARDSRQSVG
jgi:uncharacterized membrane protein YbhN (UPF0104 family)